MSRKIYHIEAVAATSPRRLSRRQVYGKTVDEPASMVAVLGGRIGWRVTGVFPAEGPLFAVRKIARRWAPRTKNPEALCVYATVTLANGGQEPIPHHYTIKSGGVVIPHGPVRPESWS